MIDLASLSNSAKTDKNAELIILNTIAFPPAFAATKRKNKRFPRPNLETFI
jgi:hypothetical protein